MGVLRELFIEKLFEMSADKKFSLIQELCEDEDTFHLTLNWIEEMAEGGYI